MVVPVDCTRQCVVMGGASNSNESGVSKLCDLFRSFWPQSMERVHVDGYGVSYKLRISNKISNQ